MNSNTFRLAALAVAAAPVVLLAAVPAHAAQATPGKGEGRASAVVLRTGLDVSLLNKSVHVPLKATLNEVQAPASAEKTALSVNVDGMEGGAPVSILRADVATANATVDEHRAVGLTNLVKARIHVPGLTALSLVEVEKVTSKAVCEAGKKPVAESNVLGHVAVLGKKVTLSAGGPTRVAVPGVGEVTLDLSKTVTTERTAAATALQLKVAVNPLNLNVAEVNGEVTLAEATCETPKTPGKPGSTDGGATGGSTDGGSTGGSTDGGSTDGGSTGGSTDGSTGGDSGAGGDQGGTSGGDVKPQTGPGENLAETGGSSATPYIAGGAALLLAVGAGATVLARRRGAARS
ncbi:SCO1860 family LAETG-anchored protein [Streptomyces griseus]|uniref:SCO1860 family LAETG-anchored protein n=1 Tax=Streptomyces griseus TaxID=1911 RepID=UPI0004C815A6|nr:SCO1860 family LAETG-anchored protein [Streptomyces griseus]